jgi:hypothetical protein
VQALSGGLFTDVEEAMEGSMIKELVGSGKD